MVSIPPRIVTHSRFPFCRDDSNFGGGKKKPRLSREEPGVSQGGCGGNVHLIRSNQAGRARSKRLSIFQSSHPFNKQSACQIPYKNAPKINYNSLPINRLKLSSLAGFSNLHNCCNLQIGNLICHYSTISVQEREMWRKGSGSLERSNIYPITPDFPVKRAAIDSKNLGNDPGVPPVLLQQTNDLPQFEILEGSS